MKSLLGKILLALIASTVLALLLVMVLSRAALQRGFSQFLEQQEKHQLEILVPELVTVYQRKGDWSVLAADPRRWMRFLSQARLQGVRPPDEVPQEFLRRPPRQAPFPSSQEAMRQAPRHLWRRLFLLDAQGDWVAGAPVEGKGATQMEAINVDGKTVGWVGFRAVDETLAPEASRFLEYQNRALGLSLLIALLLASIFGYLLARSLSLPVKRLRDTVQELTHGSFSARARVESRDEIGELARRVNRLAETLEKNESARRRWTADIAHELRTPLAVLQGELDSVKDGLRPFSPATVDSLHEEVVHLAALVGDLQTLALADAGALNIRIQRLDFAGLVRQVLETFAERMALAGLQLETHLPDRLELQADAQRLRQLVQNLLENTCRYTASGGKAVVRLRADKAAALLEIEDTAPGVGPEDAPHLFERFYRAEPSRGRARGGSGLGLAICRTIVEAHGGEISAAPSSLGGVLIRASLPLEL